MPREIEFPDPLQIPVFDNHTHLDISREGEPIDVAAALREAARVGVTRVMQIGCDLPSARLTIGLVDEHPQILGGVALHPNDAPRLAASGRIAAAYDKIEEYAAHPRVRVVGETGLDFFRTGPEGRGVQEESFRWHIDLAKRLGKTLQIHDRDAHDDVLRVLDSERAPEKVVLHCFSGDVRFARECVDRGYHLSFAGPITFKSSQELRDALAVTPLDRVLVETDAPYLTPHPFRGATNAPVMLPLTVRRAAAVLGVSVPELCHQVNQTGERLYGSW